ncbi:MAG: hypothetical protein J3Q66DRAFT_387409 [Benniella sp.]|nr:MAG: hypothetical protein J3Q66DRAFT_387409 [Benniella sp.]
MWPLPQYLPQHLPLFRLGDDVEDFIDRFQYIVEDRFPSLSLQAPTAPDASPVQTIQAPESEQSSNDTNTGNTNTAPTTSTPANAAVLSALEATRIGVFESHLSTIPRIMYQNFKDATVVTLDKALEVFRRAIGPTLTPGSAAQMILQIPFNASYSPGAFWFVLQHIAKSAPQITEDSLWETFIRRIQHLYDGVLREVMGETRREQLDALNEEYQDDLDVWLRNLPSTVDDPYPQVTARPWSSRTPAKLGLTDRIISLPGTRILVRPHLHRRTNSNLRSSEFPLPNDLVTCCEEGSVLKWQFIEEEVQRHVKLYWGASNDAITVTGI